MSEKDIVAEAREFRRIAATFTALSMLLIGKLITESQFVTYLIEVVCDVQKRAMYLIRLSFFGVTSFQGMTIETLATGIAAPDVTTW